MNRAFSAWISEGDHIPGALPQATNEFASSTLTTCLIENNPFVFYANQFLCRCWNRAQIQLAQQASLVDGLDKSRAFVPVDLHCRSDDFSTESVCLVVKSMHRRRF